MKRLKILFISLAVLSLTLVSYSLLFAVEESLSITTYYPSPYGVYNELRLYPHSAPVAVCNLETEGTMYYDIDEHQLKVCDGSGFGSNSGLWASSGKDIYNTNKGNVGIGTTAPRTLLHLKRADEIDIWIEGDSPDIKFIHLPAKWDTWRIGLDDDNGNFRFTLNTKNTGDPDKMLKDNLFVITPDGDLMAKGATYSGGTAWSTSDRAHKKDIDYNFQYGLKAIEQLKPVYYILKDDEMDRKQIGFIAQDVKEVIPELVDGVEGTYSLAYAQFVPVLVNAVKEQQKQMEDWKSQIAEQQKQIEDLKAQINELKGR